MSVDKICKEEERSQRESEVEKRVYKKCKHHIMICDIATIDDDESCSVVVAENAADKSDVRSDVECSHASSDVVFSASSEAAHVSDQQQSTTIMDLEERVVTLTRQLRQARQNGERWKTRYMEKVAVDRMLPAEEEGQHIVEFASKAVEELMRSEDSYMRVCRRRSDRARKEYRKAIALLLWTNGSNFYESLRPLLVAHVKTHLWQTVFHPVKILMRMDLAGGMLSMEGLEVLRLCETDGEKYIRNTIICSSADIKHCCKKVDTLAKHIVPYERGPP